MASHALSWSSIPAPVCDVAQRLHERGHSVSLAGEGLADLLCGRPAHSWVLTTNASAADVCERLAHAVPVRSAGAAFVVPSRAGPVDLVRFRWGSRIEDDLAHAGLRVLAMAWSWPDGRLVDPYGGLADLAAGRLATVGDPATALAELPLVGLVAARMLAEHDLTLDPAFERALADLPPARLAAAPTRLRRREISALLMADHAGAALALLRETGLERGLGLRSQSTTGACVDAMPKDRVMRLVAWTAGHGGGELLARLRFDREVRRAVRQILQYHPVEQRLGGTRRTALQRALRRLPGPALDALMILRETQLADAGEGAVATRQALAALRESIARLRTEAAAAGRQPVLIWQGRDVIRELGIEPGPRVGAALRYLKEQVARDPEQNTPDALRSLLAGWQAGPGDEGGGSAG